jgi:hypothetical protein
MKLFHLISIKFWLRECTINIKVFIETFIFAEDQVIISDNEDTLQTAPHELNKIILGYNFEISIHRKVLYSVVLKGKAVPLHAMEALGGRGGIAPTHSRPRNWMGVSGQRHAPAALLPPGKGPPVPIVQEGGWAPEPV